MSSAQTAPPQGTKKPASGQPGATQPSGGLINGPPVPVLNIIRKNRRGDILQLARLDGLYEMPLTSATEPNNDEKHFVDHHRGKHAGLGVTSNSRVERLNQDFLVLEKIPTPGDVDNVLESMHAKLNEERASAETELYHDEEALRMLERQMKRFREENQLMHRPADQPASKMKHFAVIAAIIVIESVLNANFFAQASSSGLLGGWMEAMFVSLMNVGVAVVVGVFVLRELWHVKIWRKACAGAIMLGYVAFVVFFNLVTAHFRDLLEKRNALAHVQALPDAVHHPFAITFSSLMLFVVGIVWAGLGLREGVTSDDVYPGYGNLSRRLADARLACAVLRDGLWHRTRAILAEVDPACASLRVRGEQAIERMQEIEGQAEILEQQYVGSLQEVQDTFERGLRGYREENMRIRMTPPPAYFRTFEKFPDQLDRETLATFEPRRIAMAGPLADLRVAVAKMASENNDRVQKARDAHGEFLKKVEMKVDSSIDLSHASTPAVPPAPHSKG